MCPYHNIRESNRRVAPDEYRQEITDAGEMMVNSVNDIVNLDWALGWANLIYGRAYVMEYLIDV